VVDEARGGVTLPKRKPFRSHTIVLVRHAETEWSVTGRHTSFTDLPLTAKGASRANALSTRLKAHTFESVLTSPLRRSVETCRIAGFGQLAQVRQDLTEWDYGDYEGMTTDEIRQQRPGWLLWVHGAPGGETPNDVQSRVDRIIAEVADSQGDVAIFSHGHLLRALAARWISLPVAAGRFFRLTAGGLSTLTWEREIRVLDEWNTRPATA
jgi:broad specificity phosphatase PhoE